jgi:3-oxoacyl-[acyl-carrier-protein] synthase-1
VGPLFLTKFTAVTALGHGLEAQYLALCERRSGLHPSNFENIDFDMAIGRVKDVETVTLPTDLEVFDCRNNQLALLGLQQDGFQEAVMAARARYGPHRVAVLIGTSTSGILETERAYRQQDLETGALPENFCSRYRYTHNTFSVGHFVRSYLRLTGPAMVVSTACSSSAKVFASASRWITAGFCDAAVVGGVDSLCLTTLCGFSALDLVSKEPCRPCAVDRDGLSIGEAAGFALLEKENETSNQGGVALLGYGESCDAHHMSHPHPMGTGAILAMQGALRSANLQASVIDYIQLHGTATKANDRVEDKAVSEVFGSEVPCSSTKGWTGHTLGAAGAVGSILASLCLTHGLIPGTVNTHIVDPEFSSFVILENQRQQVRTILSNFFGFGGNNCCLIFGSV